VVATCISPFWSVVVVDVFVSAGGGAEGGEEMLGVLVAIPWEEVEEEGGEDDCGGVVLVRDPVMDVDGGKFGLGGEVLGKNDTRLVVVAMGEERLMALVPVLVSDY